MIKEASKRFNFNLGKSIMVGDRSFTSRHKWHSQFVHVETGHGLAEKNKILENIDKMDFLLIQG